ncbi:hypothetical protein Ddc_24053 [Ditylenchus destructor]|nr:hypothetical protein Ddc_24053 [Ditylenchus destructor]
MGRDKHHRDNEESLRKKKSLEDESMYGVKQVTLDPYNSDDSDLQNYDYHLDNKSRKKSPKKRKPKKRKRQSPPRHSNVEMDSKSSQRKNKERKLENATNSTTPLVPLNVALEDSPMILTEEKGEEEPNTSKLDVNNLTSGIEEVYLHPGSESEDNEQEYNSKMDLALTLAKKVKELLGKYPVESGSTQSEKQKEEQSVSQEIDNYFDRCPLLDSRKTKTSSQSAEVNRHPREESANESSSKNSRTDDVSKKGLCPLNPPVKKTTGASGYGVIVRISDYKKTIWSAKDKIISVKQNENDAKLGNWYHYKSETERNKRSFKKIAYKFETYE